jgi:hypothetical protein
MEQQTAVRLIVIAQRKANELFEELIAELRRSGVDENTRNRDDVIAPEDEAILTPGYREPWSLDAISLPDGSWAEIDRSESQTYGWPDGSIETFKPMITYAGVGLRAGITLSLGHEIGGNIVGFIGSGVSRRGLTVFFPANDFDRSGEMVSMIRGGGDSGRAGFGPTAPLPPAYAGFTTAMLRERVAGKWNVQAVIADHDDFETMLNHTALQAKLRGLI